jgi:Ca-activated chloride channel homolog
MADLPARARPAVLIVAALPLALVLTGPRAHAGEPEHVREHFSDPFAAYAAGNYDEALRLFLDAEVAHPKDPRLAFDIGNVYYRKGDFAAAVQAYSRALDLATNDPALRAQAAYNLGNAHFRAQQLEEAIGAYEKSLASAPKDGDARYNLEAARRAIEERRRQQQQQQDQNQSQQQQQPQPAQSGAQEQQQSGEARELKQGQQQNQAGQEQPEQPQRPSEKPDSTQAQQAQQAQQTQQGQQDQGNQGAQSQPDEKTKGQTQAGTPADKREGGPEQSGAAVAAKPGDGKTLSREEAERYLQQLGDTRPKPPRNRRGGRSAPPAKDW